MMERVYKYLKIVRYESLREFTEAFVICVKSVKMLESVCEFSFLVCRVYTHVPAVWACGDVEKWSRVYIEVYTGYCQWFKLVEAQECV